VCRRCEEQGDEAIQAWIELSHFIKSGITAFASDASGNFKQFPAGIKNAPPVLKEVRFTFCAETATQFPYVRPLSIDVMPCRPGAMQGRLEDILRARVGPCNTCIRPGKRRRGTGRDIDIINYLTL